MAETSVSYTIKTTGDENTRKAIIDIFDTIFTNDELGEFADASIGDGYILEVEDSVSGSVEIVVEVLNTALFFLNKYKIENYAIDIEGTEDRDYGAYNVFKIVCNNEERYIQQVLFDVDYDSLEDDDIDAADIGFETREIEAKEQLLGSKKILLAQYINESDVNDLDVQALEEYEDEVTAVLDKYDISYADEDDDEE